MSHDVNGVDAFPFVNWEAMIHVIGEHWISSFDYFPLTFLVSHRPNTLFMIEKLYVLSFG